MKTSRVDHRNPMDIMFGRILREFRRERRFSQEYVALEMDISTSGISLIERGEHSPYVRTLLSIAAVLNVRPSMIFERFESRLGDDWRGALRGRQGLP